MSTGAGLGTHPPPARAASGSVFFSTLSAYVWNNALTVCLNVTQNVIVKLLGEYLCLPAQAHAMLEPVHTSLRSGPASLFLKTFLDHPCSLTFHQTPLIAIVSN